MREELELDIDSHAFVDHPTIGAFKLFLAQYEKSEPAPAQQQQQQAAAGSQSAFQQVTSVSCSTPQATSSGSTNDSPESAITTPLASEPGESCNELRHILRTTIAEAMGVEVDEIVAAPDLASMGMDSLMSLTILGTLRERTGLEISSELFAENGSLVAVEKALGITDVPKPVTRAAATAAPAPAPAQSTSSGSRPPKVINTHPGNTTASIQKPLRPDVVPDHYPHRKAMSTLLQGRTTAKWSMWMVPDGSGSATSYTEISKLSPDWAVWGLFSPFMKTPHEYKCGVYGMATKFIEEMRRRQPSGPYSIAGWSAGGVIAFEMVQQLTRAGQQVDHLILIDSPCPITIEPLPKSLHEWFAGIGLLGQADNVPASAPSKQVPEWLLPHFAASVTALSNYWADPIPQHLCPRVVMTIWCEDGVCKLPTDPRPDPYPMGHAQFLLDNRTDFGPNRWDEYLDEARIVCRHMPGNHFTMMHGDLVSGMMSIDSRVVLFLIYVVQAKQLGAVMAEAVRM